MELIMIFLRQIFLGLVGLLFVTSSHAIIIGGQVTDGSGIFEELGLPFSTPLGPDNTVGDNTFQTPNLYAFNEGQNITLTQGYNVNIGSNLIKDMIISSHYVFFDPNGSTRQEGWVDFDADILAVITQTSLLDLSDTFLNNNVTYLNPGLRGLESNDSVSIGTVPNELNRLYVNWVASTPGDYVRVITGLSNGGTDPCSNNPAGTGGCPTSIPEPSILALMGLGLAGIGFARRKRQS